MALRDGFPSATGLADALDVRLALAGLVVRDTSGNPRPGIFPRHGNHLVSATATMNSAVGAFEAVNSRAGQGAIFLANDGVTNVLHPNAPAANSRYDIVYEKQNDSVSPNADANSLPVFGVLAGAPSSSPTLPTYATAKAALDAAPGVLPGAEPLEAVLIPSTATSTSSAGVVYTALHQFTSATGGTVWFRTKAELDLWTTAVPGQHAFVIADGSEYVRIGSAWAQVGATNMQLDTTNSLVRTITQVGIGKILGNGTGALAEAVTFPVPFTSTPVTTVTILGSRATGAFNPAALALTGGTPSSSAASTTGFTANILAASGTYSAANDYYYSWSATGAI